jgi:hypothetical protein
LLLGISLLRHHEFTSFSLDGNLSRGLTMSEGNYPRLRRPPSADSEPVVQLVRRAQEHLAHLRVADDVDTVDIDLMSDFISLIAAAFRHDGRLRHQLKVDDDFHEGRQVGPYLNAMVLLAEMITTFQGNPDTAEEVLSVLQYPESTMNFSEAICSTIKEQCSVREFLDSLVRNLRILRPEVHYVTWNVECPDTRYVQFLVRPNGAVIVEVISNLHGMDWALSSDDEDELRAMGFRPPSYGSFPNWWQECRASNNFEELLQRVERVMLVVFKEQLWEMVKFGFGHFTLAKGQKLEDYLLGNRAYSKAMSDPEEVSKFLGALDDPKVRSNWLRDE